jgi:hypothetical protein
VQPACALLHENNGFNGPKSVQYCSASNPVWKVCATEQTYTIIAEAGAHPPPRDKPEFAVSR